MCRGLDCQHQLVHRQGTYEWAPRLEPPVRPKKTLPTPIGFERSLAAKLQQKKIAEPSIAPLPMGLSLNVNNIQRPPKKETRLTMKKREALYNTRYKTQLCMHFMRNRFCPAGRDCHYAHGEGELRLAQDHPKFRTKTCKHFDEKGSCPFGENCYFIHEYKSSNFSLMDILRSSMYGPGLHSTRF